MNNDDYKFAPKHYRVEWQEAPRWSRIPYGYFCRGYQPAWRIVERAIFWTMVAGVGALLIFWN